ncbi:hypothetical protein L0337_10845 [candidate division KSB1 bacterium]|nr:hypothetical protein [candidate division KSB1 bacterium]
MAKVAAAAKAGWVPESNHRGIVTELELFYKNGIHLSESNHRAIQTQAISRCSERQMASESNYRGIETELPLFYKNGLNESESNHRGIDTTKTAHLALFSAPKFESI